MKIQPHMYDVPVQQLNKLDSFVGDPAKLERALGVKLDGTTDEDRFRLAARALFGREVDETLDMLKEGDPGFLYLQTRKRIDAAMRAAREAKPREKAADDFDRVLLPTERINGPTSAAQPQQPL